MSTSASVLDPLDGKSATLYLVAGVVLAAFATNTASRVFAGGGVPAAHDTLGPAGFCIGLVGLFGLYPALVAQAPALARVAAAVASIPLVGWFVVAGFGIGEVAGVLPDASVALPGVAFVVVFLTTVLAYVLFGAASLRADVHSRTVGVMLLAPAAVFLALIVGAAALPAVGWFEVALDGGHAVAHLALGFVLRNEVVPTDGAELAADATP